MTCCVYPKEVPKWRKVSHMDQPVSCIFRRDRASTGGGGYAAPRIGC